MGSLLLIGALIISVLSLQGQALELPAATDEGSVARGSKIKFTLNVPSQYKYGKGKADDGTTLYYFDILEEQDINKKDFTMEFTLSGYQMGGQENIEVEQAFFDNPAGVKDHIVVYDDATLTNKQSNSFELTAGFQPDNQNAEPWVKLTFPSGTLEGSKDYYVVFEPKMYATDSAYPLKYYLVYHFRSAPMSAEGYSWQGDTVKLLWTEPSADYVTTETPSAQTDASGAKYFYNECGKIFCPGKDQTFSFDIKGSGANNIYGSGSTGNNAGTEPPANHIFIYSDKSLSDKSLVASAANGKITDVQVGDPKTSDGMKNVAFTVPKNTLEDGKDYYLVTDENLETNKQNGTPRVIGAKTITKITAKHDDVRLIPSADPTCTESGWEGQMKCETCGTITEEGRELPPRGHFASIPDSLHGYIAASCTEKGWMPELKCDRCGILMSEAHEIDPLGHVPNVIEGKKATCTETGLTEGQVCARCKEVIVPQETIPLHGDTLVAIGEAKEATCTEKGITAGKKCSVCGEVLEEQKEIPALGHDEKVSKEAKAATCTEDGWTEETKCSRCNAVIKESKAVKAKGHTEEVVKGKDATCTEKGLTDGKKCSVCGEVLEAQKDIPALGHDFKDGKCTRCDAADPDYKPTPVEPVTKFTGLADSADKNGDWWYYTDGEIDKAHTGVDHNKYGWWRVENGKVNFKAQGIYQNQYGWWKTTDGEVTFKENSIYQNEYGWWKCKDSKVYFNAQSIYQNKYGWWKTTDGKVTFKENGLFKNQYGTWKVENSKVNFNYNGTYQGKTIKNGKVQ